MCPIIGDWKGVKVFHLMKIRVVLNYVWNLHWCILKAEINHTVGYEDKVSALDVLNIVIGPNSKISRLFFCYIKIFIGILHHNF